MVHHSNCPLCNSADIALHLRCRDHFLTGEDYNLFKCNSCGFLFTQDHPDEDNAGRYYESDEYASHHDDTGGFSGILYRISRNIMLAKKRRMIKKTTGLKTGKLLDIGSGSGHFLNKMKNAGWDVSGIEINKKARDQSVKKFSVDVMDPKDLILLKNENYDCITLWHVLEHFHDPFSYAREIKRILKPGGICIIAVPNSKSYDAEHYSASWAAYDVPRHLWHFNPYTFNMFAGKTGFRLIKTIALPLDVFYISILSEKYKDSAIHFIPGILKGGLFSFLSLFRKEKSSSLVYFLGKQS